MNGATCLIANSNGKLLIWSIAGYLILLITIGTASSTMTQEHPITPPPELVEQWLESTRSDDCIGAFPTDFEQRICTAAARWGADMELEACCEWLKGHWLNADLRAHRGSRPPGLKEQAFELVDRIEKTGSVWAMSELDIIRRALEFLPD